MNHPILFVYADASVQPHATGLGAAIKDERGRLIAWRNKPTRAMTCNVAEYAALIFALEQAAKFQPAVVHVYSDSRLVVEQVHGWVSVHDAELKSLHRQARELIQRFQRWTLTHIPRERNQLADAIANEALADGGSSPTVCGGRRSAAGNRRSGGNDVRRGELRHYGRQAADEGDEDAGELRGARSVQRV